MFTLICKPRQNLSERLQKNKPYKRYYRKGFRPQFLHDSDNKISQAFLKAKQATKISPFTKAVCKSVLNGHNNRKFENFIITPKENITTTTYVNTHIFYRILTFEGTSC